MSEPDVIVQLLTTIKDIVLAGILGIGGLGSALLGLMWLEIRKLRSVRHDDRDNITSIHSEYLILKYDFDEYKKDQFDLHQRQHEDMSRLKWLIEQMDEIKKSA